MNRSKKSLCIFIFASLLSSQGWSQASNESADSSSSGAGSPTREVADFIFGVQLRNISSMVIAARSPNTYILPNLVALLFNGELGDLTRFGLKFSAGATLNYSFVISAQSSFDLGLYPLINEFKLAGTFNKKKIAWGLGILNIGDRADLSLNNNVLGLDVLFMLNAYTSLNIATGYSGLIFASSSTANMSLADRVSKRTSFIDLRGVRTAVNLFSSPRLLHRIALNTRLNNHKLMLSLSAQEDFRDDASFLALGLAKDLLFSQYLNFSLTGPILYNLFYDLYFSAGLYQRTSLGLSMGISSVFELNWNIPGFLRPRLVANIGYASGGAGTSDFYNAYISMNDSTEGFVNTFAKENLIWAKLLFAIAPLDFLGLSLQNTLFFRQTASPPFNLNSNYNSTTNSLFLGNEIKFNIILKIFDDLALEIINGVLIPNAGIANGLAYRLQLRVNLDF